MVFVDGTVVIRIRCRTEKWEPCPMGMKVKVKVLVA